MNGVRFICAVFLMTTMSAGSYCLAGDGSAGASAPKTAVTVDLTKRGEPISKYVYGQFIEHLGQCIYGGIWAEMLEDRKFYYPIGSEKSPWKTPGPVGMTSDYSFVGEHALVIPQRSAIRQGGLGLVQGKRYLGYIWLRPMGKSSTVEVALRWAGDPNGVQVAGITAETDRYEKFPFEFTSGGDTTEGALELTVTGDSRSLVGTISLMPADNVEGMRADTLALLKELNSPIYRWPGGNFVSGYDWRDGIGERDRRPPRPNLAWDLLESNDFGIDEFMTLCRLLDTEPYIAVNSGFGDDHSAAKEVEYVNGSADTPMGRLRAANGHVEPYGVKWWGIGNEMYGDWQLGHMSLEHYSQKHNRFAAAMRKADPSIKIVAVGDAGAWSEGMLKSCADRMDLISEHFYCNRDKEVLTEYVSMIRDNVRGKVAAHRDYRKRLDSLAGKDIRIAIDEWNYWYGPRHYNMKDAMGIAAGLHEMFRNSDIVFMANYAQTVNVIGAIKTSKTAAAFDTTGLVLKLYRSRFGELPVVVSGAELPLDVAAALSGDGKVLTIGIVNPTQGELELPLEVKGARLGAAGGRRWHLSDADPMAHNEPGKEPKVTIKETPLSQGVPDTLKAPALSVSLYELPLE
jgi:alpha-N-arabinofuranosidase